jgi:uncharacterized protein (DUF362 family)/NAD-dependent dihydropyrimidine dehydrogenase PreA subunit
LEKVVLAGSEGYDPRTLRNALETGFETLGFQVRGLRILLKPNLLASKPAHRAVTTDPRFVRAVAESLLDRKCVVHIGDSPGYESVEKVMKACGLMQVIDELGLNPSSFRQNIVKRNKGFSPYHSFTFGEDPAQFDGVINLPKLKTHGMMGITLGVKNTFGFIHAFEKAKWHLKAGADRALFASVLIDIHNLVKPMLTIVDGIRGMDGEGPSSGRARDLGLLAFSTNAYALDRAVEQVLGIDSPLPVSATAERLGLLGEIKVIDLGAPEVKDFRLPKSMVATDWSLPPFMKRALKAVFVKKPRIDEKKCANCSVCIDVCPSRALRPGPRGPEFDYASCIRCYCCQEMCPQGAVVV